MILEDAMRENSGVAGVLKRIKNVEVKHMEDERYKNVKLTASF